MSPARCQLICQLDSTTYKWAPLSLVAPSKKDCTGLYQDVGLSRRSHKMERSAGSINLQI
eukprot:6394245-Pyramimonas_sp.AAC.3